MRSNHPFAPWAVAVCAALLVGLTAFSAARQALVPTALLLAAVATLVGFVVRQLLRMQRDLALARQQAQTAELGKRVFLTHMGREIHAPLQDLLGMFERLDETQLSAAQRQCVQSARRSAQHLLGIFTGELAGPAAVRQAPAAFDPPPTVQIQEAPDEDLPETSEIASATGLIDTASYNEIASMMAPDTLGEWLATLFEPPSGSVHMLVASLAAGDPEQIADGAQKLKGSAMRLGFRALERTSAQIERLAREENSVLRLGLGKQLLTDMTRTQQAVKELAEV